MCPNTLLKTHFVLNDKKINNILKKKKSGWVSHYPNHPNMLSQRGS